MKDVLNEHLSLTFLKEFLDFFKENTQLKKNFNFFQLVKAAYTLHSKGKIVLNDPYYQLPLC